MTKMIRMETQAAVFATNAVLIEYPKTRKGRNAMRHDVPSTRLNYPKWILFLIPRNHARDT